MRRSSSFLTDVRATSWVYAYTQKKDPTKNIPAAVNNIYYSRDTQQSSCIRTLTGHLKGTILSPALFNDQFCRNRLQTTETISEGGVDAKRPSSLQGDSGFTEDDSR